MASFAARNYLSNNQKLARGIWPWEQGLKSRLPMHYKRRVVETHMRKPIPVHYRPDPREYVVLENGERQRIANIPIPVTYPPESHQGLWGGEGFVVGYAKKNDKTIKPTFPKMWKPQLINKILYSEILDKWMDITVTKRTLDLIDEAYGFDFYILKTHEVDLKSRLGMYLKRQMLTTLTNMAMYKDNPEKQQEIYGKYKEFLIPAAEVEWLGLTLHEAEDKQAALEQEINENPAPLKEVYMGELVARLTAEGIGAADQSSDSFLSKLNPFKST